MMLPVQMKMARAAIGWGVREVAKAAGVTANTVTRIENGGDAKQSTMIAIQRALEAAGVEFTNGGQPGVRMSTRMTDVRGKNARLRGIIERDLAKAPNSIQEEIHEIVLEMNTVEGDQKGLQFLEAHHRNMQKRGKRLIAAGVSRPEDFEGLLD